MFYEIFRAACRVKRDPVEKYPLTANHSEIVNYTSKAGLAGTAVAVTRSAVSRLNTIIRCKKTVKICLDELHYLSTQMEEHQRLADELPFNHPDQQRLYEEHHALACQHDIVSRQLQTTEDEMAQPQKDLFEDWELVLEEMGMLGPFEDYVVSPAPNSYEEVLQSFKSPSAASSADRAPGLVPGSQVAVVEEPQQLDCSSDEDEDSIRAPSSVARSHVMRVVEETFNVLCETRDRLDNWDSYVQVHQDEFDELIESGQFEASRTVFDVMMHAEARDATGEVIRAEKDHEDALHYARHLGFGKWLEHYQESNFPDHPDDGYAESLYGEVIAGVDRGKIDRWIAKHPSAYSYSSELADTDLCPDELPSYNPNMDWEVGSVGISESGSMVAEGKERKRIDRWRSLCQEMKTLVPEELQTHGA
jgi:hypothetical protein